MVKLCLVSAQAHQILITQYYVSVRCRAMASRPMTQNHMEVDDPTATDFTRMRPQDQYMIAAQGTLKRPHDSQSLRTRAVNLRAWQNHSNSVSVAFQHDFGASYAEYRRWQRTLGK